MPSIDILAPAKVNLILKILGKRPDGYHELKSLMAPVSLADRIGLALTDDEAITMTVDGGDPAVTPGPENLCWRAARYYLDAVGVRRGVHIALEKRIPVGAGLGGGSSDAAAVILGLSRLVGVALDENQKKTAGFEIGADVPFFFAEGPAWVGGIGEAVAPVAFDQTLWFVILHPGINLSTGAVFSGINKVLTNPVRVPSIMQFNFRGIRESMENDMEASAIALAPVIGEGIEALSRERAARAMMTGSGSAVIGLYAAEDAARRAARALTARLGPAWSVHVVHTL